MAKYGISQEILSHGPKSIKEERYVKDAFHDVASQAHAHLSKGKSLLSQNVGKKIVAYSSGCLAEAYLEALSSCDFNPVRFENRNAGQLLLSYQLKLLRARYFSYAI